MQLGKFTDYGLRVLIHLSVAAPDRVSVARIAATQGAQVADGAVLVEITPAAED